MFLDSQNYLLTLNNLLTKSNSVRIAVAFWGKGAEDLVIKSGKVTQIICNLTSGGTNPKVIVAIQAAGIKVRHLADLHAKVVLGGDMVILGSANFSANGLSLEGNEVEGWQEAGCVITSEPDIKQIENWFSKRWDGAVEIDKNLLKQGQEIWKMRGKNRIAARSVGQPLLSMPASSLERRDIVVAVYREENISDEAQEIFDGIKRTVGNKALTNSWTVYEDWGIDQLKVGQTVIDVHIGKKGGVKVGGPFEILSIEELPRKNTEQKMTLHVAKPMKRLMGLTPEFALDGIKQRFAKKASEPIFSGAKVFSIEEFIALI